MMLILGAIQGARLLHAVNADALYALSFVHDVFFGTASLRWFLTPANGFFPDHIVVGAGLLLGADQAANFILYGAAYSVLLFGSATFFLTICRIDLPRAALIAALGTFLAALDIRHNTIPALLVHPAMHGGVLPVAFLIFGFVCREAQGLRGNIAPVSILTGLIVSSDMIAVPQIVAPIGLLTIYMRRNGVGMLFAAGAGTAGGLALRTYMNTLPTLQHGTAGMESGEPEKAIHVFVESVPAIIVNVGPLRAVLIAGGLIWGIAYLIVRRKPGAKFAGLALITLSSLAGIVAPLAIGTFMNIALVRHQLPAFTLPIFAFLWLVFEAMPASVSMAAIPTALAGLIAAVPVALFNQPDRPSLKYLAEQKAIVRAVSDMDLVFAGYWDTKTLYAASDRKMWTCAIVSSGMPYPWITNLGWCSAGIEKWASSRGIVAVGGEGTTIETAKGLFGEPDKEITVGDRVFWAYHWSKEREDRARDLTCSTMTFYRKPC